MHTAFLLSGPALGPRLARSRFCSDPPFAGRPPPQQRCWPLQQTGLPLPSVCPREGGRQRHEPEEVLTRWHLAQRHRRQLVRHA